MTFHRLYVFCKVVEYQSFSDTATDLYTTQPSITNTIKSLEEKLGVELFTRHRMRSKGITLTEAGKQVYETSKEILALWNQLDYHLSDFRPQNGKSPKLITVITGCSVGTYLLPQLLNKFRMEISNSALPEICIATNFHDGIESVKYHLYDIAIFPEHPYTDALGLPASFVFKEKLVAIGNSDVYKSNLTYNIEDLQLILPLRTSINWKLIEDYFIINKLTPNVVFEVGHPESVKRIICSGPVVSILPYHAAIDEIKKGTFVSLKLLKSLPVINYKVALAKNRKMTQEVSKLLTFLRRELNHEPASTNVISSITLGAVGPPEGRIIRREERS